MAATGRSRLPQVWAETLRNETLAAAFSAGSDRGRAADLLVEDADAGSMARTMIALAQGLAAQMAVFGQLPPDVLRNGVRALMSVRGPRCRA